MSASETRISVRVYPNAARSEVTGFEDEVFQVRVAAPPVKGKANNELVSLLSKVLGISKSSITLVRGHTSRSKVLSINGLNQEDIIRRLSP